MSTLRVSSKGWVVIPIDLRKKYHLTPGTPVDVVDYGGALVIVPVRPNPASALYGMFAGDDNESWADQIVEEHRREREREERRIGR